MPFNRLLITVLLVLFAAACGGERGAPAPASAGPAGAVDGFVQGVAFPAPASGDFCLAVQKFLANTAVEATNTVFTDMPEYRHSKPSPKPLLIYQVVTYAGTLPIMVSCKMKTAAHLRAAYGPEAAGDQRFCPAVTRELLATAVGVLRDNNDAAAAERAAAFVIDHDEPYMTGRDYLAEFPLTYRGEDGAVHITSHGLFQDYDSWITAVLPRQVQGQSYCHLATVEYLTALARGEMEPGTVVTTADDAPVVPAGATGATGSTNGTKAMTGSEAVTALRINDIKVGDGAVATPGQTVVVHYTGWLYDPTAPNNRGIKFDSSQDRNAPFDFPLGGGRVIQGWDQGVDGMKIGGRRELVIPAELGYGARGAGGVIPPDATLVFEVELLALR